MSPREQGGKDRPASAGKAIGTKPVMAPRARPVPSRPVSNLPDERKAR